MAKLPSWLETAVFYEIYPQSFRDSNGDGIGDLPGIIEKLDYIQALGCNALWLNPCFDSPFGDAGYDVADYCRVAPRYGSNDDAKALFDAAHARGMHVIFDLVPGHTSSQHPWFEKSKEPGENEYSHRYVWTDSVWNAPNTANITGWLRGISDRDGSCAVNFFHPPAGSELWLLRSHGALAAEHGSPRLPGHRQGHGECGALLAGHGLRRLPGGHGRLAD